ncbi:ABC transporter permease [Miniphocaeibacter halophilus]|uniref:ABC transporter permease n=1 Tax=Miniphocaeibacter halophilus TaxID=2931922 RepID=A0AC61MU63_9FIRM|nr:ABC transporter permease [Miniphocaeibacter halophilus]QQK09107.1 ABC transporter permease [Miniphocaeibacter halophilus]
MENKKKNNSIKIFFKKLPLQDILSSFLAILLAFLVGSFIIYFMDYSPIKAFSALFKGAFGDQRAIFNTIAMSIPLMFTGLAVAVGQQGGMLNIGAEGQLYIGAMGFVIFTLLFPNLPKIIMLPIGFFIGMLCGGLWGAIPGLLKAKKGINEVIVCIMLNYIATLFTSYLVNGPFKGEGMEAHTNPIPASAQINRYTSDSLLGNTIVIALITIVLIYIFLWKTNIGYKIRTVGKNRTAAEAAGINVTFIIILTMFICGAMSSLAGITEISGNIGRFRESFSPSYGFTGIAVSILGRNHPIAIIFTALLFGMLNAGSMYMSMTTSISTNITIVIQSLVIIFVAAPKLFSLIKTGKRVNI